MTPGPPKAARLQRVELVANERCPRPVVVRSVRLVERKRVRFAMEVRTGLHAEGRLALAPDAGDDAARARRIYASWPDR